MLDSHHKVTNFK